MLDSERSQLSASFRSFSRSSSVSDTLIRIITSHSASPRHMSPVPFVPSPHFRRGLTVLVGRSVGREPSPTATQCVSKRNFRVLWRLVSEPTSVR